MTVITSAYISKQLTIIGPAIFRKTKHHDQAFKKDICPTVFFYSIEICNTCK